MSERRAKAALRLAMRSLYSSCRSTSFSTKKRCCDTLTQAASSLLAGGKKAATRAWMSIGGPRMAKAGGGSKVESRVSGTSFLPQVWHSVSFMCSKGARRCLYGTCT